VSLQRALLLFLTAALLAGIVPAGVVIDRRLAREVTARARDDLAQAPRLLAARDMSIAEGMRMHAKEVARAGGLVAALRRGDRAAAVRAVEAARAGFGDGVVLVATDGRVWAGPHPGAVLLDATRRGENPISVVSDSGTLHSIALAPVVSGGRWLGAAGVTTSLGRPAAGMLSALTRSDVLITDSRGVVTAATTPDPVASVIATQAAGWPHDGLVREVEHDRRRYMVAAAPLGDVAMVVFVRDLTRDLDILPAFRRVIAVSGLAALLLSLVLGSLAGLRVTRPVRALADAADRLAGGDGEAPLMPSSIREIDRLSHAFDAMRRALAARIQEVTAANRAIADRQDRLAAAQAELLQRERLAVSARLVAELSHEIRNPIANLRNCLEIVRRRVSEDPEGREFTDLAIDELLRMHELAEQMLDLNRPRNPAIRYCHVATIVREVAALVSAGLASDALAVRVHCEGDPVAAMAHDALKQVLLNLVHNARDAIVEHATDRRAEPGHITISVRSEDETVVIEVDDDGPGIRPEILPQIFDPFFTTKGAVQGVGLGLFVAQGLVRSAGGRLSAGPGPAGRGTRFALTLGAVASGDTGGPVGQSDRERVEA